MKKKNVTIVLAVTLTVLLAACGGKKKSEDIIAQPVAKVTPKGPVSMQSYTDERNVSWLGKTYHVAIHRQASDSLPMVKDENGQEYVDNLISVAVSRQDGSVFFGRVFKKTDFAQQLDADYSKTGILEGLVFDKVDGDYLVFAASVSHPQADDEYIPLVVRLSRMGNVSISRDTQMDTNADVRDSEKDDDEDGV